MRATRSWSRRRAPSSRRWERGSSPRLRPGSASSCTDVAGLRIYETAILPEWIDYNGHLRDAYYTLIVSLASDALMDRLHLDAAYRKRTSCTLYTVEMHIHYLDEVKATDTALVGVRIVGADHKRIHAAFEILRAGHTGAAAVAEVMLLHVRQQGETAASVPFPPEVQAAIAQLEAETAGLSAAGPPSRRLELSSAPRSS
ncbi:MAG: thioesterase [Gammaproteobacteria bacterium]|nr:MAG: thioesterase [Gammaproteobacteria bacterium]TLZ03858.1 MAG: thioesterase [Gammaproteobacteria bacterium]TLZ09293.1 MAG: thioesterase [Gammaproteobacteria bacterium]TLZ26878.1 MAG: thioesterase [Gammaproteobacteria bacterium]